MDFLNFNSVETLPAYEARAAFTVNSSNNSLRVYSLIG